MKKTILLFVTILVTFFNSNAQVVRIGILTGLGGGGSVSSQTNSVANVRALVHVLDASYAPTEKYDVGIYADMGVDASDIDVNAESANASVGFQYGIQGKYYFLTNTFKPFIGFQAGLNSAKSGTVNTDGNYSNETSSTKFQVTPQAGFRVGPLNVWGAYRTGLGFSLNGGLIWSFGNFK